MQEAGVHAIVSGDDHQLKIINQTQQVAGPKGLFHTEWNWDHQSTGASWDTAGAGGVNYTGDVTTETSIGWNPSQKEATDPAWSNALVQLEFN